MRTCLDLGRLASRVIRGSRVREIRHFRGCCLDLQAIALEQRDLESRRHYPRSVDLVCLLPHRMMEERVCRKALESVIAKRQYQQRGWHSLLLHEVARALEVQVRMIVELVEVRLLALDIARLELQPLGPVVVSGSDNQLVISPWGKRQLTLVARINSPRNVYSPSLVTVRATLYEISNGSCSVSLRTIAEE